MSSPKLVATPGHTIGPFYGYALPYDGGDQLVPPHHPAAIQLTGRVLDGNGDPVVDSLLEIWQADENGNISQEPGSLRRDGFTFTGWGRTATDNTGRYSFTTVEPGASHGDHAPFIAMTVFARGLLNRLFTRVYLPGDDTALTADRLLASLPPARRSTLIASLDDNVLTFDVVLQGQDETVFLTYPGY